MPFDGLTDDMLREKAPSVFATHAAPNVSERYEYLPSYQVVRELRTIGLVPVSVREGYKRNPAGRPFAIHQIRFRKQGDVALRPKLGDVFPEAPFLNSHDRTSGMSFAGGLHRLICTNGMTVADQALSFRLRHVGHGLRDKLHAGMEQLLKNLGRAVEVAEKWNRIIVPASRQIAFANEALAIKGTALHIEPETILHPRRWLDQHDDLWSVFNRVQENITKGGIPGRTASGCISSLKSIRTLAADVDFNSKLWTAAAKVADEAESRPVPSGVVASA